MTVTRSYITFVVEVLSQYMQTRQLHWDAASRVLQYLSGAPGKGLLHWPSSHLNVVRYSDADWARDPLYHHSISGCCTFVGGNLVTCAVRSKP